MSMLRIAILGVSLAVAVYASAARAETSDQLMKDGIDARRRGDQAGALRLFQRAHALDPSPAALGQMGVTEQSLKQWEDSETHLASALGHRDDPWVQGYLGPLEKSLDAVRGHLGEIEIIGTPAGADVYVNGRARGSLALKGPLRVSEGDANVQITAAGFQPHVGVVRVRGRATSRLDVSLEKVRLVEVPMQSPVSPTERAPGAREKGTDQGIGWKWTGIGLAAAGAASVLGGGAYLLWAGGGCDKPVPMEAVCNNSRRSSIPGWGLIGAGVAAGVTGGIIFYRTRDVRLEVAWAPEPMLLLKGSL